MKEFFNPSSVAVIGASSDVTKVGGMVLRNLVDAGYGGRIFPINIKGGRIQGIDAYPSVEDVGEHIDLAVICVKAPLVVNEIRKLGRIGTKRAVIITAGFKESGNEGRLMENELSAVAREFGMRIVGPNCFGVMSTQDNLNTTFSSLFPPKGSIALTSQSGAVGATMLDWSREMKLGISKFVSLGNKADVSERELLEYLGNDPDTRVIGIYSESIPNGLDFMEAVAKMRRKPLVILKSGRTSAGSKAASSHTGALAGADSVYNAVFDKLNMIRASDLDEMFDSLSVFSLCDRMDADGVAIITNAGGLGVMAADASAGNKYVSLAELSPSTIQRLSDGIPEAASVLNPVDLRGDTESNQFAKAVSIVADDPAVGGIVVLSSPLDTSDLSMVASAVCSVKGSIDVPLVACFAGGEVCTEAASIFRDGGVPTYPDPERAVRALAHLRRYTLGLDRKDTCLILPKTDGKAVVDQILSTARSENRVSVSEEEGKRILSAYGIPVPGEGTASTAKDALALAERIGYPVVMKIMSADIQHKTDVGGVIVGIKDAEGVRDAFETIVTRCRTAVPSAKIDGVSVQRMASGQEVILSMVRDDQFGPVISFGLGGIYVEIMGEISQAVLPMSSEDLDNLLRSTKAFRMLSGARGKPPADVDALKEIILRLIRIAEENEDIYELEINPVMVGKRNEGCWAVDCLMTVRWKE